MKTSTPCKECSNTLYQHDFVNGEWGYTCTNCCTPKSIVERSKKLYMVTATRTTGLFTDHLYWSNSRKSFVCYDELTESTDCIISRQGKVFKSQVESQENLGFTVEIKEL